MPGSSHPCLIIMVQLGEGTWLSRVNFYSVMGLPSKEEQGQSEKNSSSERKGQLLF